MYKGKNGKVFASLTEVKNKTGDIFALVDEYGEVTLTSYNKPRYKISKIDLLDVIDIKEEKSPKSEKSPARASIIERVKTRVTTITPKITKEENESISEESTLPGQTIKTITSLVAWDRYNREERLFITKINKSLQ